MFPTIVQAAAVTGHSQSGTVSADTRLNDSNATHAMANCVAARSIT